MKFFYRVGADAIFILHFLLVLFVVFGWLTPRLWPWYMAALVVTLISDMVFGYCILSKWEFDLRKKHNLLPTTILHGRPTTRTKLRIIESPIIFTEGRRLQL